MLATLPMSAPLPRPPRSTNAWPWFSIRLLNLSCAEVYIPALAILPFLAMLPRSIPRQRSNTCQFEAIIATHVSQTLPSLVLQSLRYQGLLRLTRPLTRPLEADLALKRWKTLVVASSATHLPLLRLLLP